MSNGYLWGLLWCFGVCWVNAQSYGYEHWQNIQNSELHLKADYREKRVEERQPNRQWKPVQIQTYREDGRLKRDQSYHDYPALLYDIYFEYNDEERTAQGTNSLDSSQVTYAFTPEGWLRYYVVDRTNNIHIVYTYDQARQLKSVKDCMAPFGNHYWCAYYTYTYNREGQLAAIHSHNLRNDFPLDSLELFSIDSIVYQEARLAERWTLNAQHEPRQVAYYTYNRHQQLIQEVGSQLQAEIPLSYHKRYRYRCNRTLLSKVEQYYKGKQLQGRQENRYHRKGWLMEQKSYRQSRQLVKHYRMIYSLP